MKKIENERIEKEKIEKERLEKEKIEKEKIEKERVENERIEKERVEREKIEKEKKIEIPLETKKVEILDQSDEDIFDIQEYFGKISGQVALGFLDSQKKGTYMLRWSERQHGYMVSYRSNDTEVCHIGPLQKNQSGFLINRKIENELTSEYFPNLHSFLSNLKQLGLIETPLLNESTEMNTLRKNTLTVIEKNEQSSKSPQTAQLSEKEQLRLERKIEKTR